MMNKLFLRPHLPTVLMIRPQMCRIFEPPKHEKEIASLINSYRSLYNEWVFELRYLHHSSKDYDCARSRWLPTLSYISRKRIAVFNKTILEMAKEPSRLCVDERSIVSL